VLDASATSPTPGQVLVSVLARDGDGVPTQALLDAVHAALTAETVRPLTDEVRVQAVDIMRYRIAATVYMLPGPDASSVMAAIRNRAQGYADAMHRIGRLPTLSGIYAALHIDGVARVELQAPLADVVVGPTEASYCERIQVDFGGVID
jgi:phage-related baseplate assembly protein